MPDPGNTVSSKPTGSRAEFFRHSGWLMVASNLAGWLALGVHFLSKRMSTAEYGLFGALAAVTICIPAMPLQMAFTHQTATAMATGHQRQLAGLIRAFCGGGALLWLLFCLCVVVFQKEIFFRLEVSNATAVWVLLPVVLLTLWSPVMNGLLQGCQNFLWLGWSSLLSSLARLLVSAAAVLAFRAGAAGLMTGLLVGAALTVGVGVWQNLGILKLPADPSTWRSVLRQTLPLLFGFGAFQVLFSIDPIIAKGYFGAEEVGFYVSAGILSRALMYAVNPLAQVMFPRIVHSHVRSEKTSLLGVVFIGTAVLAVIGAVCLSLVGPWVIRLVYDQRYVEAASRLLPWYAAAMVPLTLANVLINNLLARGQYRVAPVLCVLVLLYILALTQFHRTLVQVLQVFGVSNLVLLVACVLFTRKLPPTKSVTAAAS